MAKGHRLSLAEWTDRLLSPPAPIVRKSKTAVPGYVRVEELGAELWGRGHMLIVTKTQIVVLKSAHMVVAA